MRKAARRSASLLGAVLLAAAGTTAAATAAQSPLPSPLGLPPDGLAPTEVDAGDLNGDEVDDLAVANEGGNTITVLLSHPAGGYQPPQRHTVGVSPSNVHIHDFTGDGVDDVVDIDAVTSTISVLPNQGDGTLGDPVSTPTNTTGSAALTAADVNTDGHLDVAVTNPAGGVAVSFGRGDGSFDPPKTYPGPPGAIGVTSEDFDNDGAPDLAAVGAASITQSILLNRGDGTFDHTSAPVGTAAVCNRPADLNEDGNTDLVAGLASGHMSVLEGRGDGTFAPAQQYPTGAPYSSCFGVGDLDADGHEDVAVGNIAGLSMSVLRGRGDGTLGRPAVHPAGDAVITCNTGHINGDDAPDVICPGGGAPVLIAYAGNGDGTFSEPKRISLG